MATDVDDLFFKTFMGVYVRIVTGAGQEPIEIRGYVLHKDEKYLYVGADIERIDAAVDLSKITMIEASYEEDEDVHQLLKDVKEPKREEDLN